MRHSGKYVAASVCALLLLILSVGGIAAYFVTSGTKDNPVTAGQNVTEIGEEFPDPLDVPEEGADYVKKVWVENRQSVPCYIRAAVEFSSSDTGYDVSLSGLNKTEWTYISAAENEKLGGYYYYKKAVSPGQSTECLFEGVSFRSAETGRHVEQGEPFEVIVYEESVQAGEHSSYLSAWDSFIRK